MNGGEAAIIKGLHEWSQYQTTAHATQETRWHAFTPNLPLKTNNIRRHVFTETTVEGVAVKTHQQKRLAEVAP